MKEKFIVTFKGTQRQVPIRTHYEDGLLEQVIFMDAETPPPAREWCLARIPAQVEQLENIGTIALIEPEPADLSFNAFWEAYGNKQNKDRTYRFWTALTNDERIAALRAIPKYNRYLTYKPNIERKYPDTWLKNRCWTDEYHIKH